MQWLYKITILFCVKALESLEADNFHDDPHADLVMSKKALNLFQESQHGAEHSSSSMPSGAIAGPATDGTSSSKASSRKRLKTAEYYKQRYAAVHFG